MTKTKRVQSISGCGGWIYTTDHIPYINKLKGVFEFHFEDRNENFINKMDLLKIGDMYEKEEIKDRRNLG